jgi:hypothetical protein
MRLDERKPIFHRWAIAAMLLACTQPALAGCKADDWNVARITIDASNYEIEHIRKGSELQLSKRSFCNLKMQPLTSWNAEFANLNFNCKWEGTYATEDDIGQPSNLKPMVKSQSEPPWWEDYHHCISTRLLSLHTEDPPPPGKISKHRVVLVPYFNKAGKHAIVLSLVKAGGARHAGVAHGTD